jgi:hypothetical protein
MASELQPAATPLTTEVVGGSSTQPASQPAPSRSPRGSARRRRGAPTPPCAGRLPRSWARTLDPRNLTPETVRAYCDQLERGGRTPATVAKHLSALRQLAQALDADPAIRTVRSQRVARGERAPL